jgi:hypothetical protein
LQQGAIFTIFKRVSLILLKGQLYLFNFPLTTTMKKFSCLLIAGAMLFICQLSVSSCTKTETKTVTVTDTVTKTVTKTVTDTLRDTVLVTNHVITYPIANLLLGKQWIVDSLFHNYNGSGQGTPVYKRGGSGNLQNLDDAIVIMWPDGGQLFFYSGNYYNYTYSFQNADSTELLIHNPNDDYARIVDLTNNHLTVYDSTNSALSYYEYKP